MVLREIIEFERPVKAVDRYLASEEYASLFQSGFSYESGHTDERGNGYWVMTKVIRYQFLRDFRTQPARVHFI